VPLDGEAGIIDEGPPHEKSAAAPEADEEASAPAAGQDAAGAAPAGPEAEASTTGAVTACFCQLPRDNGLRSACIAIYESPNFDRTTLTLIFLNCITLALYDPLDPDCKTSRCEALAPVDKFLGVYFTCEMIVKMFALGVFRYPDPEMAEEIYFDSAWNRFDCFIVVTSWIDWIPGLGGGSFSALRAFRALRPLRAVNKFPQLKVLVKLLLDTIPMLASVGLLCFIIFFVYGILATQLWMGLMHQRCFNPAVNRTHANYLVGGDGSGGEGYWVPEDGDYVCAMGSGAYSTGLASCSAENGVPAQFSDCRKDGPIPFQGAIAYDNILQSWLVLFQIITLEGWVDQMYVIQGAFNFTTGWVFFCSSSHLNSPTQREAKWTPSKPRRLPRKRPLARLMMHARLPGSRRLCGSSSAPGRSATSRKR
jgi:voltage-dependent calcium channel T type alpha-1I